MLELFPSSSAVDGAGAVRSAAYRRPSSQSASGRRSSCTASRRCASEARALRAAVEGGRIVFGTKAFPNLAVLRLLREEGLGADVASSGELAFALAAGLTGDEIVVHGNNKDEQFLGEAAPKGDGRVRRAGRSRPRGRGRRVTRARAGHARRRRRHARGDPDRTSRLEVRAPARPGARARRRCARSRAHGARVARPRRLAACRLRRAGRDDRAPCVLRGLVSRPTRLDAAGHRPRRWFRHPSSPRRSRDGRGGARRLGGSDGP